MNFKSAVWLMVATFFAGISIASAVVSSVVANEENPCARAFEISDQVISWNTELLTASGNGITAVRNGDDVTARKYADDMGPIIDKIQALQPEYDTAATACRKEKQ